MTNMNFNTDLELKSDYTFNLLNSLDNIDAEFSVEFYIDERPNSCWQGICKVVLEDCELAAAAITSNLDSLTGDLIQKIVVQLPNKYDFYEAPLLNYMS